jgi:peroxiredoxin family protein
MKSYDELEQMTDKQLRAYMYRRFKSSKVQDDEEVIYVVRSQPCQMSTQLYVIDEPFDLSPWVERGYRVVKYAVIDVESPGRIIKDY